MRKLISSVFAAAFFVLPASTAPISVSAANSAWQGETEVMSLLSALNIMVGDDDGDYKLDEYVTRAQMAKIVVASSSSKNQVAVGISFSPFSDVKSNSWASPYVQAAVSAGIVSGYIDGTFRPDGHVTYEEAVTMMLRVLGYNDEDFGASYPYGQIGIAENLEMTRNVNASIGDSLTRRQVAYLVRNALDTAVKDGGQDLIEVHNCKIIEDITIVSDSGDDQTLASDEIATSSGKYRTGSVPFDSSYVGLRGDMVIKDGKYYVAFSPDGGVSSDKYVVYSLLNDSIVAYKSGDNTTPVTLKISGTTTCYKNSTAYSYSAIQSEMEMGDIIRVRYNDNGEVDYINYSEGSFEGPIKLKSNGSAAGFATNASTQIMRDGVRSGSDALQANDIVYYSPELNMVFAYSKKITGVYESASPSKDSPSSVVVSGVSYAVEGTEAFKDLSSAGTLNYGDTITLLMGKDGVKAAGVITNTSSAAETVTGFVTGSGTDTFTNSDGTSYTSYYLDIVTPDGTSYKYPTEYDKSSNVSKVVRAKISNGYALISNVSDSSSLSGYVNYAKMQIGNKTVAANANIMDVSKIAGKNHVMYAKTYMQRIDGITLNSSNVAYYDTNSKGEITDLILQNVTGDMYKYGMTISSSIVSAGVEATTRQYSILADNNTYSVTGYSLTAGTPVAFALNGMTVDYAVKLMQYSGSAVSLSQTKAVIGSRDYLLSDKVKVYRRLSGQGYQEMSLNDAIADVSSYNLTCYYDKPESNGGRIRVIIADSK